jgi:uncharacterized membrane protein
MDQTGQFALAYALSTTAGLRGFLTLLAASLAAHFGWIHPSAGFAWLGSTSAIAVLAVFSILEVLGDKIPAVDHLLQIMHTAVRPVAAAILVGSTIQTDNHTELYALMGLGAVNSLVVHGSSVAARAASTMTTAGTANPLLSLVEDGVALGGILLSFFVPVLAAVICLIGVIAMLVLARKAAHTLHARAPAK